MKFYYWRRGRNNANKIHVVFTNREDGECITAFVELDASGVWTWTWKKPWAELDGSAPTKILAQEKIAGLIAHEFRPDTAY